MCPPATPRITVSDMTTASSENVVLQIRHQLFLINITVRPPGAKQVPTRTPAAVKHDHEPRPQPGPEALLTLMKNLIKH